MSVPIEEFVVKAMNVEVLSSTEAMAAICRAALDGVDVRFRQEGEKTPVHIALIEAGNITEDAFLKQARANYPTALFVALGAPKDKEAFDFTVNFPINFHELRDIVSSRVA